ncbi:hypothetical protein DICVIV_03949 [Dictyocaulus viviparus]|uniref:Uncharacterized protein n=1 Tax=Dictyocaulus viviparus TaxID=29172 RepID=A0A0D8Y1J5_DICVI|nr:hypothetical protein DICVIV_03949 [Dictyocaulus viviparus]
MRIHRLNFLEMPCTTEWIDSDFTICYFGNSSNYTGNDEAMIDESNRGPDVKMFSLNSELGNVSEVCNVGQDGHVNPEQHEVSHVFHRWSEICKSEIEKR